MAQCRPDGLPLHVKEYVYRVRGQYQVDQDAAEIDKVLDGVHGKPRPGTNAFVSVVHRMGDLVKRHPMQQSMNKMKMK